MAERIAAVDLAAKADLAAAKEVQLGKAKVRCRRVAISLNGMERYFQTPRGTVILCGDGEKDVERLTAMIEDTADG